MTMWFRSFTLASALLLIGCSPNKNANKFADPVLVQISDFKDRRLSDSLYQFLRSENPVYRLEVARAFASIQDSLASTSLGDLLLEDPDLEVREAAAFSLGQTGGFLAVNSLIPAATDKSSKVVGRVLEALGKTLKKEELSFFLNFNTTDSLVQTGLAMGLYHVGLRGLADSVAVQRCTEFLNPKYPQQVRLMAAHFFSRSNRLPTKNFVAELRQTAARDKDVYVRMAAANALRNDTSKEGLEQLRRIISKDNDYRVRCNAVRALNAFAFDDCKEIVLASLHDANLNVAIAAAELIKNKGTIDNQNAIVEKARTKNINWRVQAELYSAALALTSTNELIQEVESIYTNSQNNYQKAWLLGSLSKSVAAFSFIRDELFQSKILVIKSAAAQALVNINHHKDFTEALKKEFSIIYINALAEGDPGVIVSIAAALSDSTLNYKSAMTDFNFLYEAKEKLSLPKDIEALQPLEEAIAYFEGKPKPQSPKNEFNHPINWELVKTIPVNQQVIIKTSKGDVVLSLDINNAPGSVSNFVELCHQKYFDGKFFHRVVSNFVVQTGCNRGDGFGSEAYSIRSEFSGVKYKEGSVGMASAGKDTEGTQWFITHSPTPHLNGKYTIFAEVLSGMEVVHQLEVGDQILSATLIKN